MRKKIITSLLCFAMFFLSITTLTAKSDTLSADGKFHIVSVDKKGNYEIVNTFDSYAEAKVSHTLLNTKYNNLGITYGDSFLYVDQGVVSFDSSASCDVNTEYTLDSGGDSGYLNGCYGNDAAFLEYNVATNKVKFKISGVVGWANAADVTIYPYEKIPSVSSFVVKDEVLYHRLKSSALSKTYANSISLSSAPSYLKGETTYYSYDTHYFYTSYKTMMQDYRNNTYKNAVNESQPYYNYYQYMDHRSSSSYTPKQLESYLKDALGFNQTITDFYDKDNYIHDILTQSLLFQGSDAFFQYQNQFGSNALMMLSLSLNESAMGRSYIAYNKNNLFGHAAYDSSAEESASRYASVGASVYSHALHYISKSYLNPQAFQFHGGYFGNKAGGMNVSYASDPYWGEKAAQYYYQIDAALGSKDLDQYAIGISQQKEVSVYTKAAKKADTLYTIPKGYEGSFILLEKVKNKNGTWYRVQSDVALNKNKEVLEDGTYPYKYSYGFVKASDIDVVRNQKKVDAKNYVTLTFDAVDGTFYPDSSILTMQIENGMTPVIGDPVKTGYLFDGWDIALEPATNNLTYKATYKKVKSMQLIEKPAVTYNVGDTLNIKGGKVRIDFEDGKNKEFNLTTDMVSGFDNAREGKQNIQVQVGGNITHYEIEVTKSNDEQKQVLLKRAAYIIKTYSGKTGLTQEAMEELIRFREDISKVKTSILTRDQIRVIDRILQENLSPRYSVIIQDDLFDLQTSGLALALQGEQGFLHKIMPKTIKIELDEGIKDEQEELVKKIANANGMEIASMFTIDGTDDFSSLKPKSDMVYSLKKPKKDKDNRSYRVYYIDGEDVYQLPSSQSASRILLTSDKLGSFALVYQNVDSVSQDQDFSEVNTIAHNGKNYIMSYIILPIAIGITLIIGGILYLWYQKKHKKSHKRIHPKEVQQQPIQEEERNHE
ncbi:MAG: glucosaminidase domain-containing protein [Longicatena sp.]